MDEEKSLNFVSSRFLSYLRNVIPFNYSQFLFFAIINACCTTCLSYNVLFIQQIELVEYYV